MGSAPLRGKVAALRLSTGVAAAAAEAFPDSNLMRTNEIQLRTPRLPFCASRERAD